PPSAGSGFFDPGAGFPNRLAASVSGGITVNSVTSITATSVTLNLSTVGAATVAHDVTITNPDGQHLTGTGILTTTAPCPPTVSPTSASFNYVGGTGSVSVTINAGCAWTATSNASWITSSSGASGTGNATGA